MSDESASPAAKQCPLSWPDQRWNLILFALCTGMQYLAAPVLYVGITQASLCNRLGADARTSNLPGTLYFAMTAMPAVIAWMSPRVSALKRNLGLCYLACALMLLTLAITLSLPVPSAVKLGMVILQGAVSGAVMPAAIAMLWEVIGRGSDESRRGLALSLAFGAGPILAVLGSLGQTALLGGDLFGWHFDGLEYPRSFIVLFGAGAPVMGLAAVLSQFFVITPEEHEPIREPISAVTGLIFGVPLMFASVTLMHFADSAIWMQLLGGICAVGTTACFIFHFRSILQQRLLLLATLVTVLVYAGNVIPSNMNLYSEQVLGNIPEKYAGIQNMLRFGFKVVAGSLLGWMLMKTSPRAGILATSLTFLTAMIWAMLVSGPWYLVAFGLHGAGELVGVYAPNYIVSASRSDQMRRNMAFVTMLMVPAAPAGYLYGAIVDAVKRSGTTLMGMNSETLGYRLSFAACAVFILAGIVLAVCALPARPRPEEVQGGSRME